MNETNPDLVGQAAGVALDQPLPANLLPPAVTQLLSAAVPAKIMAARGIAPLRPADLGVALYQLTFDADAGVQDTARKTPETLPDRVLLPLLKEALPAPVLHFFAVGLADHRAEAIEAILYNRAVPDAAFVALAKRLPETMAEVICQNEQRLLRCPDIVVALFSNPSARMSSVNRAIELCARNGVQVDISGFDEIAKAILGDPAATDGSSDAQFSAFAETATAPDDPVAVLGPNPAGAGDDPAAAAAASASDQPAEEPKKQSMFIDFTRLKLFEKVRLANFGNAYCRINLIRDPARLVAMSVVKSPKITDPEIIAASASRNVHEDVVRYISNQREYTKMYAVRWGLVTNPKCPLQVAMRLLSTLNMSDIKKIARSRNISSTLSNTAKRIVQTKGVS